MADLTLVCQGCRQPIEGDTGCLRVTLADLDRFRRQEADYGSRHPAGEAVSIEEFLTAPDPVSWHSYHDRCDPEKDLDAYQIDAAKLSTWQGLARWTAHLMEKNWLGCTDWDEVLREVAGVSTSKHPRIAVRLRSAA